MYVRIGENLGQGPIKPIPPAADISQFPLALKQAVNVFCRRFPTHFAERELQVPFRAGFNDFLREVQRAVGRRTVFRHDPGHRRVKGLVQPWEDFLRNFHQSNLAANVSSGTLVKIRSFFFYRGVGKPSERVCGIMLLRPKAQPPVPTPPPSIDQCRKETIRGIKGFLVCKKPCVQGFSWGGFDWELVDSSSPNECTYMNILTAE